jgi:ornithine carbamoyltransferase
MTLRHFLSSDDLSVEEQSKLIDRSIEMKSGKGAAGQPLARSSVALLFEKPSTRTRVSFEAAINELGGNAITLRTDEIQLGRGETIEDSARVLSRYVGSIVVRTFAHERIKKLAEFATVPVINALTDIEHPCQALADVMTIRERFDAPGEVRLTYIGDGNNVANSLLIAGAKAGLARVTVACPIGYEPDERLMIRAEEIGQKTGTEIVVNNDAIEASKGAHVLYTDVWTSMGQEGESQARLEAFQGFQLNGDRIADADPRVIVMHCLPAHRGEEITGEVIDGPQSAVWDQAENRLHTQKALLEWLIS